MLDPGMKGNFPLFANFTTVEFSESRRLKMSYLKLYFLLIGVPCFGDVIGVRILSFEVVSSFRLGCFSPYAWKVYG